MPSKYRSTERQRSGRHVRTGVKVQGFEEKEEWNTKVANKTIGLYPGDFAMLDEMMDFFGSSASDVFRTALRSLHAQTEQVRIQKKRT